MEISVEQGYKPHVFKSGQLRGEDRGRLLDELLNVTGVYVFSAPIPLSRVRGSSKILYIGQSGGGIRSGKQGVRNRILKAPRGMDMITRELIETELFPNQDITLWVRYCKPDEDACAIEDQLLREYWRAHLELPPANHKNPGETP